jgi:hypothetical protein
MFLSILTNTNFARATFDCAFRGGHALGDLRGAPLSVLARDRHQSGGYGWFREACEAALQMVSSNRACLPAFNWFDAAAAWFDRRGPAIVSTTAAQKMVRACRDDPAFGISYERFTIRVPDSPSVRRRSWADVRELLLLLVRCPNPARRERRYGHVRSVVRP